MLLSFEEPTSKIRAEAASAGFFLTPWGDFPRLQLLTIDEALRAEGIQYPRVGRINQTFRASPESAQVSVGRPPHPPPVALTRHPTGERPACPLTGQ